MTAYSPSPKQALFHQTRVREVLWGGASGGGKSTALRADPLVQATIEIARIQRDPTVAGVDPNSELGKLILANPLEPGGSKGWYLLLRRELKSIKQFEAECHALYKAFDKSVRHNINDRTFIFGSGFKVELGHCQNPNDWESYQGNEYTGLGFDELVQFLEEQYQQIALRLRSTDPVLRHFLRIRCTSNPVMKRENGQTFFINDPQWVKRRFVDEAPEGNTVLIERVKRADGSFVERERMYIPATLYDNPDKDFVSMYEETLLSAPSHMRDAMLWGRWDVVAGAYFSDSFDRKVHVIEPFRIPRNWAFFRSMDWGYREPGCIHWWALSPDDVLFCIREYTFKGTRARHVAIEARAQERKMKLWDEGANTSRIQGPADNQLWEERGDEGLHKAAEFSEVGIHWVKADKSPGSRRRHGEQLAHRMRDRANPKDPPRIYVFRTCVKLAEKIPLVQTDLNDMEAPADQPDMHWMDSAFYAVGYAELGYDALALEAPGESVSSHYAEDLGDNGYGGF